MKTQKRNKKINKPLLIIVCAILAGLITYSAYAFVVKPLNKSSETVQTDETTSDQQQSEDLQANPDTKDTMTHSDAPAEPTTTAGSDKKQVQMIASVDQSNGMVYIRGGANYPVPGGTCYAQLSGPSGQSIKKDSAVLQNPASTDCKTISIATSDLAPGKWTFTLNYTSDEYEGASVEVSFTI